MTTLYKIADENRSQFVMCYWDPETGHFNRIGTTEPEFAYENVKYGEWSIVEIMDEAEYWEEYTDD